MHPYNTPPAYVSSSSNPPQHPGYMQQLPHPHSNPYAMYVPTAYHNPPQMQMSPGFQNYQSPMDRTPPGQIRRDPSVEMVHSSPGSDNGSGMSPCSDMSLGSLNLYTSPDPPLPVETQPPEPPPPIVDCGTVELADKLRPYVMRPKNPMLPSHSTLSVFELKSIVRHHRELCRFDSILPLHPETGKCDFKTMCISLLAAHADDVPDSLELIAALTNLAAEEMELVFASKDTTIKSTKVNRYERYQRVLRKNMDLKITDVA